MAAAARREIDLRLAKITQMRILGLLLLLCLCGCSRQTPAAAGSPRAVALSPTPRQGGDPSPPLPPASPAPTGTPGSPTPRAVHVTWLDGRGKPAVEARFPADQSELCLRLELEDAPAESTFRAVWSGDRFRFVDAGPAEEGKLDLAAPAPRRGWKPGAYTVEVYLGAELLTRQECRVEAGRGGKPDLPLRLPGPPRAAAQLPNRLAALRDQARQALTAAAWRIYADEAVKAEFYSEAAAAYREEARVYRQTGDGEAAIVEEGKAARYSTQIRLYSWQHPSGRPGARLEPASGCYVGAFIDRDDNLPAQRFGWQRFGDVARFNQMTGKRHASFFTYLSYGKPFPAEWVTYLKEQEAYPHLAWEPSDLSQVKDDRYLQDFVSQAAAADWPIFIRFAGEMNGDWTAYHGNPAAYREAFRTVYRAFRRAPRVALIWCPNAVPQDTIEAYYPGDEFTDWVGVNFYSVFYLDNDARRPAEHIHPIDMLDFVYARYSHRKPIAIGEYAATQAAAVDGKARPEFAVRKMEELYSSLPTRYPRVKLVSWYDCDNRAHARPGRRLNNYLVTEPSSVLERYSRLVSGPHFLGAGQSKAPVQSVEVKEGSRVSAGTTLEAWVRSYDPRPQVFFRVNGRLIWGSRTLDRHRVELTRPGPARVEVLVYDGRNRFVQAASRNLVVGP